MTNIIQTFFVNPDSVSGASTILLTSVDLYFRTKPQLTNNISGITGPGVAVMLISIVNGIPQINNQYTGSIVRLPYNQIVAMNDASVPARFSFPTPIPVSTGQSYGILVIPEDPNYTLWYNQSGDALVGTNTPSSGVSDAAIGKYYTYAADSTSVTPVVGRQLKFDVNAARYTSNNMTIDIVDQPFEFINLSTANGFYLGGEVVFQWYANVSANVYNRAAGTCNVATNNVTVVGTGTTFNTLFTAGDYVIMEDGTANNRYAVPVAYVTNATNMTLVANAPFSNTGAFYRKAPTGVVYNHNPITNYLFLSNSTANSSMFFNESSIKGLSIVAGGASYKNGDIYIVSNGTLNATATITTNSTGGIASLNIGNTGYGFINVSSMVYTYSNSTGGSTTGSAANVIVTGIGPYIVGNISRTQGQVNTIVDWRVDSFDAELLTVTPDKTSINLNHTFAYLGGGTPNNYIVNTNNFDITHSPGLQWITRYNAIVMSRSHEVVFPTNILASDNAKSAVVRATLNVNLPNTNIYTSPILYKQKLDMFVYQNIINNSKVNEYLPTNGLAACRYISVKVPLANTAEDLLVYMDGWVPAGTNVAAYGKFWSYADSDAFDDKWWTPLQMVYPNTAIQTSSATDITDTIPFTFNLPQQPPSVATLAGYVTTTSNSVNVVGVGTAFTTNLVAGSLVKIYDPQFPNTNFFIAVVNAISNDTQFSIASAPTNNSILGTTFKVDTLKFNYTAWNNMQRDNVARYYNSSMAAIDGYDVFAIKIVLQSTNTNISPIIYDVRAVATSA